MKEKEKTSIAIVVSLDGSSKSALKIVMLHTDGSTATVTTLVDITRDGMNYIRVHGWNKMLDLSGRLETEVSMETGDRARGVQKMKVIDRTGSRYGSLTVIKLNRREFRSARHGFSNYWMCLCDCGEEVEVHQSNLVSGNTKSCGCQSSRKSFAKRVTTHGMSKTPTYTSWSAMKDRCYQVTHKEYKRYGAAGIKVCKRWRDSFENFFADMGERPDGCSLERIDGEKNYTPKNCVWATKEQQANNRRNNRLIEFDGKTMTLAQWAKKTNIPASTIARRIDRGWDIERALGEKNEQS